MTRCPRCGLPMDRSTVTRYCVICLRELALTAPKPEPGFIPTWRRRPFAKVLDHGRGRAVA